MPQIGTARGVRVCMFGQQGGRDLKQDRRARRELDTSSIVNLNVTGSKVSHQSYIHHLADSVA